MIRLEAALEKHSITELQTPQLDLYGVGKPFIDFNLPNKNGKIVSFKNYRGKVIQVDFWARWCALCRKKNPELIEIKKEFASTNFDIIGISID